MRVAIQGQAGSYHHAAAKQFFNKHFDVVASETFKDTFHTLENNKADYAVVAIENSLFGSINQTYDLLLKNKFWICGEVYLRIEHCLIGMPQAKISEIKEVHSQLEALAQCEDFLDTTLAHASRVEHHDTAASVIRVKQLEDSTLAAIASEEAAKMYDMAILQKNIEDNKENYTRFVVLQKNKRVLGGETKTSLVLTTRKDTKPGALHSALGAFAKSNINLTMLQSRPLVGKAWHYLFYVDLDIGVDSLKFKECLDELAALGFDTTILGSYKSTRGYLNATT